MTQNSIFDFVRQYESKRRTDVLDGGRFVVTINKDDHFLKPGDLYQFMNLEDSRIDNASEFAQVSLETMKELAGARKTKLFVILIPTKESVLFDVVHPVLSEKDIKIYRTMVDAEQQLRRKLTDFLAQNEIPFVDVLPILRNVVANGQSIYPGHDGHPNATGYKHIAEVVNAALGRLAD